MAKRKSWREKLETTRELAAALARRHGADMACPLTTGIFAWISAHAADEAQQEGAEEITPYWRTLKSNGELNPKYPGGIAALTAKLESEGHHVVTRGKRTLVEGYTEALINLYPS